MEGLRLGLQKKFFSKRNATLTEHGDKKSIPFFSKSNPPHGGPTFSAHYVAEKFRVFLTKKNLFFSFFRQAKFLVIFLFFKKMSKKRNATVRKRLHASVQKIDFLGHVAEF